MPYSSFTYCKLYFDKFKVFNEQLKYLNFLVLIFKAKNFTLNEKQRMKTCLTGWLYAMEKHIRTQKCSTANHTQSWTIVKLDFQQ